MQITELFDAIPRNSTMPSQIEFWFTLINLFILIVALVYMVSKIRKRKDCVPLYVYIGAGLAFFYEPFADYLVLCYFPEENQMTAFDALDRKIPLFMAIAYIWYIAPFALFFLDWVEKGISKSAWWTSVGVALVLGILFEELGIALGLWIYYGDQPFRIIGLPLWIPFGFMCFVYGYAAVVSGIVKNLPQNMHWTIVILGPLAIAAIHFASVLPIATAFYTTTNPLLWKLWASVSIICSLLFIWILSALYCSNAHKGTDKLIYNTE